MVNAVARGTATLTAVLLGMSVQAGAFDHSHTLFDALLRAHVVNGRVDYRRFTDDRGRLQTYLSELDSVTSGELAAWPREEQIAFWINAYNAFVLMSVIEHYPLTRQTLIGLVFPSNSIWQVPDVWKAARWHAAKRAVSLDEIENDIIRRSFREPRIHFALVCASRSCPNLRSEAYRGDRLNEQLEDQTQHFLADPDKGLRINAANTVVLMSKIFDWYAPDFAQAQDPVGTDTRGIPAVIGFAVIHAANPEVRAWLRKPGIRVRYLPYDWTLNEQTPSSRTGP